MEQDLEAGQVDLPVASTRRGDGARGFVRIPAGHVTGVSKAPGLGDARCKVELADGSVIVVAASMASVVEALAEAREEMRLLRAEKALR